MQRLFVVLLAAAFFCACGGRPSIGPDGSTVGGQCNASRDCDSTGICTTDSNFSNGVVGMCTQQGCVNDAGCPAGTACVFIGINICAVTCGTLQDCSGFGRGWTCKGISRPGGQPDAMVCRLP